MVCKVQQRYAVQECDATMMRRIIEAGYKKIFNIQISAINIQWNCIFIKTFSSNKNAV